MSPAKILMTIIICAFPFYGNAQINLVYNGSFEEIRRCTDDRLQIMYANHWHSLDSLWAYDTSASTSPVPTDMPSFFTRCGTSPSGSVPVNSNFAYHQPRTGDGMAQLHVVMNDTTGSHLYIQRGHAQGKLKGELISGKPYCVTFYISLEQCSRYASNMIGAYLDDGTIDTVQWPRQGYIPSTPVTPQVYDTTIFTDTLHWHKIQGSFTATGNEQFITIANFFDNEHTDTVRISIPTPDYPAGGGDQLYGSYLIDDISVIAIDAVANAGRDTSIAGGEAADSAWIGNHDGYVPCRWYNMSGVLIDSNKGGFMVKPTVTTSYIMELEVCGHITRDTVKITVTPLSIVNGKLLMVNVRVYPNPVIDELTIEGAAGCNVVFYDVVGREVMKSRNQDQKAVIDISALAGGVYFVKITDPVTGESIIRKLIKE